MSNISFAELFGGYIGDLKEIFDCGEVLECNLDSETRVLTVTIEFSKYIKKAIIDEEKKAELNYKLGIIKDNLADMHEIEITYFVSDEWSDLHHRWDPFFHHGRGYQRG